MASSQVTSGPKVLVIGLDGATFDIVQPWVDEGHLPNIGRLMQEGTWGPLRSTIHPLTPTAWTTFVTGKNPGKHGIYDFALFRPGSYEPILTNATHSRAASIFQLLSLAGKRVVAYNIPWTFPPEPVNGVMIAGFGAPKFDHRLTFPADAFGALAERVDRVSFEIPPRNDRGVIVEAVEAQVEQIGEMGRFLLETEQPDLCCCVFMATDQVGHVAWERRKARRQNGQAIRDVLLHTYQLVDAQIGRFLERVDDGTTVILMSDHGFGSRLGVVDLGAALQAAGIVSYEGGAVPAPRVRRHGRKGGLLGILEAAAKAVMPQGVRGRIRTAMTPKFDWGRTKAWLWGRYPKLRFNVRGREPNGVVEPGRELEALWGATCECLRAVKDPSDGGPIIEDIWRGESVYNGAPPDDAPDLVATTRGFGYISRDIVTGGTRAFLTEEAKQSVGWRHEQGGIHRMNGIFVAYGRGIERGGGKIEGASLADVAPTILHLLRVPVPRPMDGQVLHDALDGDTAGETALTDDDPPPQERCATEGTADDQMQVAERLRDLGYVD